MGFVRLDVAGCPPGNCQEKVPALLEDSLVNETVKVAQPEVGSAENSAVGTVLTRTVLVEVPQLFSTVKVMV